MDWDLGAAGVGLLVAMAIGFGLVSQVVAGRGTTRWMWLIGAGTFFVVGLLISEAWFGWATGEDLQPNYDGLSFDETLLAIIPSVAVVFVARRMIRQRRGAQETRSDGRTYNLEDIVEAHPGVDSGDRGGNVIVRPGRNRQEGQG